MVREIIAVICLLLLLGLTLYSVHFMDTIVDEIIAQVEESQTLLEEGDVQRAQEELRSALDKWNSHNKYTSILLHHDIIDSAKEAFYTTLSEITEADEVPAAAYENLREKFHDISKMERVSLGSIF